VIRYNNINSGELHGYRNQGLHKIYRSVYGIAGDA
jgi:hypothetical protein